VAIQPNHGQRSKLHHAPDWIATPIRARNDKMERQPTFSLLPAPLTPCHCEER
jgi:hypothetical protein